MSTHFCNSWMNSDKIIEIRFSGTKFDTDGKALRNLAGIR